MALEQVFECPRTLAKLRSGPLGKLLEGFCQWLLKCGFSRWSIRTHLANVSHLNVYLGGPKAPLHEMITAKDVEGFFRVYPSRCRNRRSREEHTRRVRFSVRRFLAYLREEGRFDPLVPPPIYEAISTRSFIITFSIPCRLQTASANSQGA